MFQVKKESVGLPTPPPHPRTVAASGEGVSGAGNTGLSHHKAREGEQVPPTCRVQVGGGQQPRAGGMAAVSHPAGKVVGALCSPPGA